MLRVVGLRRPAALHGTGSDQPFGGARASKQNQTPAHAETVLISSNAGAKTVPRQRHVNLLNSTRCGIPRSPLKSVDERRLRRCYGSCCALSSPRRGKSLCRRESYCVVPSSVRACVRGFLRLSFLDRRVEAELNLTVVARDLRGLNCAVLTSQ